MHLLQRAFTVLIVFVVIGIAGCDRELPGGLVVAPESPSAHQPATADTATTMPPAAPVPGAARPAPVPGAARPAPASTTAPASEALDVPPLDPPPRRETDVPPSKPDPGCGVPGKGVPCNPGQPDNPDKIT